MCAITALGLLVICCLVPVEGQPSQNRGQHRDELLKDDRRPHRFDQAELMLKPRGCPFDFPCGPCGPSCIGNKCFTKIFCPISQHCELVNGEPRCVDAGSQRCGSTLCGPCFRCNFFNRRCVPVLCGKLRHCENGQCVSDRNFLRMIHADPCHRPGNIQGVIIPEC